MKSKMLVQQMMSVTVIALLLAGCDGAPAGPPATPTPVPPTAAPPVTPAPAPTCLDAPVPAGPSFGLQGEFGASQPPPLEEDSAPAAWNAARQLICDETFFIQHEQGDFNIWTALREIEDSFPDGDIPHRLAPDTGTVGALVNRYGEPSYTGEFQLESGEKLDVYWFGPIFIMAEGLEGEYREIGGWVSRLQ